MLKENHPGQPTVQTASDHFLDIQALVGKNRRALGICSLRLRVSRSQNTYPQVVWSERTSGSSLEAWAERGIWSCSDSKPMDPWCVELVASSFWFVPWLRRPFDLEEWVRSVEREWMLGPSLDHRTSSLLLRLSPPHRPRR